MIKINKNAFIAVSEEAQTPSKTSEFSVNYNAYLGGKIVNEVNVPQGYINSWIYNETQNGFMNKVLEDTDAIFVGKNILK